MSEEQIAELKQAFNEFDVGGGGNGRPLAVCHITRRRAEAFANGILERLVVVRREHCGKGHRC